MTRIRTRGRVALAVVFCFLHTACESDGMNFDKARWESGRGIAREKNPRLDLAGAAIEAGVKVGARRQSIRALLGEPDKSFPEVDYWYLGRNDMAPEVLEFVVDYDPSGIATRVYQRRA